MSCIKTDFLSLDGLDQTLPLDTLIENMLDQLAYNALG